MKLKNYLCVFMLMGATLSAQTVCTTLPEVPKLVLSAQANLRKPADELQLKVGVINLGSTAEATVAENNRRMQAVIASLEKAGLTKSDYETGQFSIQPTYTPYPAQPPHDWKPSINGYEVTNTLVIHTDQLDMAGRIIDLANKAGANSITEIRFGLHDTRLYNSEALTAAATNAISDAETIAQATGVKLVRILSINLDNAYVTSPHINVSYFAKGAAESTPIEPGDVKLTASVTLVYEIASE